LQPGEFEGLEKHLPSDIRCLTVRGSTQSRHLLLALTRLPELDSLSLEMPFSAIDDHFFVDERIQRLRRLHMNTWIPTDDVWIQQKWESACFTAITRVTPEGINQVLHQWASGRRQIAYFKISFPFKGDQSKERIFNGFEPEPSYGQGCPKPVINQVLTGY